MIWLATAWAWIFGASWRICSALSNITPAGALLNSVLLGWAEWQVLQRVWITARTAAN
ncbi:hypothetical protein D3C72_2351360 [compost metagenome]